METQNFSQTFTVEQSGRLVVRNIRGSVIVQGGAEKQISISANLDPTTGSAEHTHIELHQDSTGDVFAVTRLDTNLSMGLIQACVVDYTISVPDDCDVDMSCVSSSAHIAGVHGELVLSVVSGNMVVRDLSGALNLRAVSGGITAVRLSGELDLDSVSGDVTLKNSNLERAKIKTVSGDMFIETPLGNGPYTINTVSGDLRMVVPPETGCEISMRTLSGDLYSGLSATYHQRSNQKKQVTVLDGGAEISFQSISGDLELLTAEQVAQPIPQQPKVKTKTSTGVEPMDVLDRIERGEISVQEGVALLEKSQEGWMEGSQEA